MDMAVFMMEWYNSGYTVVNGVFRENAVFPDSPGGRLTCRACNARPTKTGLITMRFSLLRGYNTLLKLFHGQDLFHMPNGQNGNMPGIEAIDDAVIAPDQFADIVS